MDMQDLYAKLAVTFTANLRFASITIDGIVYFCFSNIITIFTNIKAVILNAILRKYKFFNVLISFFENFLNSPPINSVRRIFMKKCLLKILKLMLVV